MHTKRRLMALKGVILEVKGSEELVSSVVSSEDIRVAIIAEEELRAKNSIRTTMTPRADFIEHGETVGDVTRVFLLVTLAIERVIVCFIIRIGKDIHARLVTQAVLISAKTLEDCEVVRREPDSCILVVRANGSTSRAAVVCSTVAGGTVESIIGVLSLTTAVPNTVTDPQVSKSDKAGKTYSPQQDVTSKSGDQGTTDNSMATPSYDERVKIITLSMEVHIAHVISKRVASRDVFCQTRSSEVASRLVTISSDKNKQSNKKTQFTTSKCF